MSSYITSLAPVILGFIPGHPEAYCNGLQPEMAGAQLISLPALREKAASF